MHKYFFTDSPSQKWPIHLQALSLAAVSFIGIFVAIAMLYPPLTACSSKSLPNLLETETFVGREDEIQELIHRIEKIRIVSIVGPPGFGKSTLAIHVGHAVCNGGTNVHYINLQDLSRVDILRQHILLTVQFQDQKQSVDPVLAWTRELKVETLVILDNCDHILHKNQSEFQTLLKNMIKYSPYLKVLLTAKHVVSFLHSFHNFTITELTPEYATELLMVTSRLSNKTLAATIATLVGNVPLALQVVGKILNERSVESVIKQLQMDRISTLSPADLPATDRFVTSLNISYGYLTPENRRCARLLANFPGSFDETAAIAILNGTEIAGSECLSTLRYRSLLSIDGTTDRYRFHQLVKAFLKSQSLTVEHEEFSDQFAIYYATLYCKIALHDVETNYHLKGFQTLDMERYNFQYLFAMHISIEKHLDILSKVSCNIFDTLSLLMTSEAHVQQLIAMAKALMNEIQLRYLMGLNLINYRQLLQSTLMQFDAQFVLISNHTGKSVSFEVYVNLLTLLSKADSKVDGQSHRLQTLLSRSERVEELYHFARTDDSSSSRMVYAKFYSALANSYIRLNQYDEFLECWQKILFLKKQLEGRKNKRCSHLHKGLAYFGRGDYEQAIEHLHPLLKLESLSASRKARILILLYESYSNIGDLANAVKILQSNFYEDVIRQIFWYAAHNDLSKKLIDYNECKPPPPDVPQITCLHQPYAEPSTVDELEDDSTHQHRCTLNDFTPSKPTDDSPYQRLYQCAPDDSTYARTLDSSLQRIILKLLNQGATRENYRTLMIAATFYSSGRGEVNKGKLLSTFVKENIDCVRFDLCDTNKGEIVESSTQTCTLLDILEEHEFNELIIRQAKMKLTSTKAVHSDFAKQCCKIRKHPYWKWFYMHTIEQRRVNKFQCDN